MRRRPPLLALAALLLAAPATRAEEGAGPLEAASLAYDFEAEADLAAFAPRTTGEAARRMPKPKLLDGRLYLLESWWRSSAAVALPAPTPRLVRVVEGSFDLVLNTGTEGMGFAWLPVAPEAGDPAPPEVEAWEAPSLPGAFGVGFDASDPPNRDPFMGSGNAYDRPQHEVSLHFDGMELVKRATPSDFRDEKPHEVRFRIEFVTGGAEVGLWLDGTALFERTFVPHMAPYVGRPAWGARNGDTAGDVLLDRVRLRCAEPVAAPPPPHRVVVLDRVLNDKAHPSHAVEADLPDDTSAFGRIVLTLRLDRPETRFDPWDRLAHVWATDDEGRRHEILRYVTPYHRGHVWHVDVSEWRPVLRGKRRIEQACSTQGEGWVVSVSLAYYPGPADRHAFRIEPLWSGSAVLGDPEKPVSAFYGPRSVPVPEGADAAEVRVVVTGHGMSPNTGNAAEFLPIERTLRIGGTAFANLLWKTDNYLNPCRPQGGTWKYDRAGWAPGDVVRPWVVDATPFLGAGTLEVAYELAPYVNEGRGKTWAPFHLTESRVVFYRRAPR